MRTVTYRLVDLIHATISIGFVGENEHTRIIFDCKKAFEEYPSAVPSLSVTPPSGESYPAVVVRDGDYVYWDIMDSDVAMKGSGEGQLTFVVNSIVKKSYIFLTRIDRSIVPTGDAPSAIADWLVRANTALGAIPQTIADALEAAKASGEFDGEDGVGIDRITLNSDYTLTIYLTNGSSYTTESIRGAKGDPGDPGEPGDDGISPTITVTDITGGHRLTITDKAGTRTVDVMDGEPGDPGDPGDDGVSPTVTITNITGGHRVKITDKTGDHTFDVMDGAKGDPGDPTELINDEAGTGDTGVTFSADKLTTDFSSLLSALNQSNAATNSDIGKAHSPKTVVDGKVTEWQYVPVGGGGGSGRTLLGEVVVSGTYIEMQMLSIDCATGIITVDDASGLPDSQIGVYSGRVHLIRKDLSARLDTLPSELNARVIFSIQKISDTTIKLGGSSLYDSYTEASTIDVTKWGIMVLNSNGTSRIEISGLEIKDHMHVEIYTPTTNPDESIALKVYNQNNYDIFQSGSHERITAYFGSNGFEFVGARALPVTNGGIQNPKHGCGFPMWAFIDIRKTGDYIRYSWELNWALTSGVSVNCGYTKDIQTVLSTNKGISKFSADIGSGYDGFTPGSYLRVWEVND